MVDFLKEVLLWLAGIWFLWFPAILCLFFYKTWISRTRAYFLKNLSWTLLEIKIPRDIVKSPKAMETVLMSLYSKPSGSWWKNVTKGTVPIWYSLEIAGINGGVHFFVYVQKDLRNLVESQVYAQFSDAEISEVSDYTYGSDFENSNNWEIWASEFKLEKEDGYPIKTYVDFGLDETGPDEEQKVNPLVSFLEFLGSLKEGEQAWFQIIIKGADKKWVDDGNKLVGELMGRNKSEEDQKSNKLSKGEQEVVSAIEKNISKAGFETGIRAVYVARKDVFNPVNKASILGSMNHYNTYNLNGFKPSVGISPKPLGFLFKKKREARNKIAMLEAYRERGYFYAPHSRDSFVFNTEELATLFHFPGRVAEVPTFARIESRKSEPPPTLPI